MLDDLGKPMSDDVKEMMVNPEGAATPNGVQKSLPTENVPTPEAQSADGDGTVEANPPPVMPTVEDIAELKARADKATEYWDRLLRQVADFDNFKKRAARDRQEAIKYANEALIEKLLPVLDHFEAGLAAPNATSDPAAQALQTGMSMVFNQLKSVLQEAGLEIVDAAGQVFDPNLHEAISQLESTEVAEGVVLQQIRKGFKLRDRLLRPASVIVAKKPAS